MELTSQRFMMGAAGGSPKENWIGTLTAGAGIYLDALGTNVDSSGNVYITGYGGSTNDFFIAKYDTLGVLQWQRSLSGGTEQGGYSAIDSSGNIYLCGRTSAGGIGANDAFLAKYNSSGVIQWQRSIGTSLAQGDTADAVAVDSSGNVYIVGKATNAGPSYAGLLAKYNSSGTLQFQRQLVFGSGGGADIFSGVVVDSSGNIYISGTVQTAGAGNGDGLLVKYNSSGTLQWQYVWGGTGVDGYFQCDVDSSGNVYVVGNKDASFFAVDPWLAKIDSSGTVQWERAIGSPGTLEFAIGVKVDNSGNVYITGEAGTSPGDLILIKYNSSGTLLWQRSLGTAAGNDRGNAVAVDNAGHVFVAGRTASGSTTNALFTKLPDDGSLTGTYGSFTYATTSYASNTISTSRTTASYSSGASSFTSTTPSLTDSAGTLTSSIILV